MTHPAIRDLHATFEREDRRIRKSVDSAASKARKYANLDQWFKESLENINMLIGIEESRIEDLANERTRTF